MLGLHLHRLDPSMKKLACHRTQQDPFPHCVKWHFLTKSWLVDLHTRSSPQVRPHPHPLWRFSLDIPTPNPTSAHSGTSWRTLVGRLAWPVCVCYCLRVFSCEIEQCTIFPLKVNARGWQWFISDIRLHTTCVKSQWNTLERQLSFPDINSQSTVVWIALIKQYK